MEPWLNELSCKTMRDVQTASRDLLSGFAMVNSHPCFGQGRKGCLLLESAAVLLNCLHHTHSWIWGQFKSTTWLKRQSWTEKKESRQVLSAGDWLLYSTPVPEISLQEYEFKIDRMKTGKSETSQTRWDTGEICFVWSNSRKKASRRMLYVLVIDLHDLAIAKSRRIDGDGNSVFFLGRKIRDDAICFKEDICTQILVGI